MPRATKKTEKKAEASLEAEVQKLTNELLEALGVSSTVTVAKQTSEGDQSSHYLVTIETQESGLLIGYHGETLNSLQLLLGVMLFKKLGEWVHVVVDVGDYRKMREDSLSSMVERMVSEVERTGEVVTLPFLTPLERRMVHMKLTDHPSVVSESIGEGRDRRLTIKPKTV